MKQCWKNLIRIRLMALLELDDAAMFDEESLEYLIDDWVLFSDDLVTAMKDMLLIIGNQSQEN